MDNHDDLGQILEQLEILKKQTLEYVKRYLKGEKESQLSLTRLDNLFNIIKNILERKSDPFSDEVEMITRRMFVTPGHGARSRGITAIEGIGPVYAQKLKAVGIATTNALLQQGATPKGRKGIAEKSGISDAMVLTWVNHVDLFRIKGVGEEYADLLENAGVDTVVELAQRKAENLFEKMGQVNEQKRLVRRLPTLAQVKDWVEQAKKLPRVVSY
jgi:predicted flap endonuclease-1-like 5' DNA nuclease